MLPEPTSSLEIAQAAAMRTVEEVGRDAGLLPEEIEPYGRYKGKVDLSVLDRTGENPDTRNGGHLGHADARRGRAKPPPRSAWPRGWAGWGPG